MRLMQIFDYKFLSTLTAKYPTPFYIYDEKQIRTRASELSRVMAEAGVKGFKNFFAVKALPNPSILKILKEQGMGLDCSSLAELELANMAGFSGEEVIYTSNNTTLEEFAAAKKLGAIINFDDTTLVQKYLDNFGVPAVACCRYNPGDVEFEGLNEQIIGKPSEAKYGLTKPQIFEAYKTLKQAGVKRFGLHTMLLSNELDWQNHALIAELMFVLAAELSKQLNITFEFINLGGGIGVAYRPEEEDFDLKSYANSLTELYKKHNLDQVGAPKIVMENGRFITAEAGYLVTRVINFKDTHKSYVGVDASMANLMRPGMYGAYHHLTVVQPVLSTSVSSKSGQAGNTKVYDVVGSLCENNDKFAIDRELPVLNLGDFVVIHTAGAHGHAMGFQYNGKLRSAEILLDPGGNAHLIRRAESLDDYFATLIN